MTGQNQRPRAKPSKRSRGIATEPGAVIVPEQSPTETAQEPTPEATAMVLLHPACSAALTLNAYPNSMSGLDRSQVGLELLAQMRAVNEGDLGRGEEMLVAQAHVLDGVFNTLAMGRRQTSRRGTGLNSFGTEGPKSVPGDNRSARPHQKPPVLRSYSSGQPG